MSPLMTSRALLPISSLAASLLLVCRMAKTGKLESQLRMFQRTTRKPVTKSFDCLLANYESILGVVITVAKQ